MRISDWSSDVCSSDLLEGREITRQQVLFGRPAILDLQVADDRIGDVVHIGALLPRLPIEKARPAVDLVEPVPELCVAMRAALRNFLRSLLLGAQPRHYPLAIALTYTLETGSVSLCVSLLIYLFISVVLVSFKK